MASRSTVPGHFPPLIFLQLSLPLEEQREEGSDKEGSRSEMDKVCVCVCVLWGLPKYGSIPTLIAFKELLTHWSCFH